MDCRLVVIFLIIGAVCVDVQARKCGPGKLRRCNRELRNLNQRVAALGDDDEYPCEDADQVKQCFVDYAEECYNTQTEVDDFLEENIQELQNKLNEECAVHECLEDVEEDAGRCLETAVETVSGVFVNGVVDATNVDENRLKCMVFNMIVQCVVDKVHDKCGDEIADAFREGIEEEAKEVIEACSSGQAPNLDSLLDIKKK